ncbi:uncharacterized protein LOC116301735, partial [Actinia tenebrosa]|uniref:Uncharacterized protein LOC116301735 n=1 Tax=Actinia tenebrosa TaxID=6105 RepID=A0A6P8IIR8_ACTTE
MYDLQQGRSCKTCMLTFLAIIWIFKLSFCKGISSSYNITYRLAGGEFPNEGLVEVFFNGTWGRICTSSWDINDAKVVCRSLRLPPATYPIYYNTFRAVKKIKWMNRLQCSGNETSLAECPNDGWGKVSSCQKPAGVMCGHPEVHQINLTELCGEFTSPGFSRYMMTQAHYVWTIIPPIPRAMVLVYLEDTVLYRPNVLQSSSSIDVLDGAQKQLFHLDDKTLYVDPLVLYKSIGLFIKKLPVKVVYFSSFTVGVDQNSFKRIFKGIGIRGRFLITDRLFDEAPLKENWTISATSNVNGSYIIAVVSWSPFNVEGNFWITGYVVINNSTDDWQNMTYVIANNRSRSAYFGWLVGYTNYRIQVFVVLAKDDGSLMMYGSKTAAIKTPER